jgi:hypothetical protein
MQFLMFKIVNRATLPTLKKNIFNAISCTQKVHETSFMQFHAVQRIFANRPGFFRTLLNIKKFINNCKHKLKEMR